MVRYIPGRALEKITRLKRLRRKAPLSVAVMKWMVVLARLDASYWMSARRRHRRHM
jgi:hypothetical protein